MSGCTRRHSSRRTAFVDIFDGAEVIVGFNCLAFDFPLLQRFYTSKKRYLAHRCKCLDIMTRVRDVTDDYYKLVEITRQGRCEALWCRSSQRKPPKHKLRVGCARSSIQVRVGTARGPDPQRHVGWGWERRRWSVGRVLPWVESERAVPLRTPSPSQRELSITCKTPRLTLGC